MTKDEALKMALEALEWSYGGEPMPTKELEAINAIRQVLAEKPIELSYAGVRMWMGDKQIVYGISQWELAQEIDSGFCFMRVVNRLQRQLTKNISAENYGGKDD